MNKEKAKKLTLAVIAMVMAGTMAFSFAACSGGEETVTPPGPGPDPTPDPDPDDPITDVEDIYGVLNEDGSLNYNAYERATPVTLNLAVGHNNLQTGTHYASTLGQVITLPDGNNYQAGDAKPAWVQMGQDLNINWNSVYTGGSTSSNLRTLLTTNSEGGGTLYSTTDIFTSDLSEVVTQAASNTDILNLADYLDYMPNFKTFLLENPVVYLSLLQDGMNTSTGAGQTIYVAPYFDGYDDIERYCIVRQDWVEILLNGDEDLASSTAWGKDTSVTGFMGTTGSYTIESLNADGTDTINIEKDYDAALSAAQSSGSALGQAISAAGLASYTGASGNIVDIMNAVIGVNQDVTGAQLANIYRAYIDVCYLVDGQPYYTSATRANVFNGYDACWDVDDLVAILRCVMTNASSLGGTVGGIMPRSGANDRTPDMVRLAGQLYGARGAASQNEYTYIDAEGNLQDARQDEELYNAVANLHLLYEEGLIADYSSYGSFSGSCGIVGNTQYFMMYDYVQTQTLDGFYIEDSNVTGGSHADILAANEDYYFSPVLTPVSKWDVDGDGDHTDIMRFTESWRTVKVSGIALNGALVNDQEKLKAALQFVDYLYHEDGQIVSTFGPMASDAEGTDGFWYNEEATDEQVAAGEYFTYKGVNYSGSYYKGEYTPTITDKLYDSFKGLTVNGFNITTVGDIDDGKLNFTNYARRIIGSTLPVGVKNQSFEYQLTSQMGMVGSDKVGQALATGIIKGLSLEIDPDNYWYTCVPTALPVPEEDQQEIIDDSSQTNFEYLTGTQRDSSNRNFFSIFNWIILNGTSGTYNQQDVQVSFTSISNLLEQSLGGNAISTLANRREFALSNGWDQAKEYWEYLSSVTSAE